MYGNFFQCSILPSSIKHKVILGLEPFEMSAYPGFRESRNQVYTLETVLQHHLGNTGRGAEVAINLKRGVRTEEIFIYTAGIVVHCHVRDVGQILCLLEQAVGSFSVMESCPASHFPCAAPSGGAVAARIKGYAGCIGVLAVVEVRYVIAGV